MDFTLAHIRDDNHFFKQCTECGAINWYANKHCNSCTNRMFENVDPTELAKDIEINGEDLILYGLEREFNVTSISPKKKG